jgi:hypothetical protein
LGFHDRDHGYENLFAEYRISGLDVGKEHRLVKTPFTADRLASGFDRGSISQGTCHRNAMDIQPKQRGWRLGITIRKHEKWLIVSQRFRWKYVLEPIKRLQPPRGSALISAGLLRGIYRQWFAFHARRCATRVYILGWNSAGSEHGCECKAQRERTPNLEI